MIYKKLVSSAHRFLEFKQVVTNGELQLRNKEYDEMTPRKFNTKRTKGAFVPIGFEYQNRSYELELNKCVNPLCKNFGLPQEKFNVKGKPSRYRVNGKNLTSMVLCNPEKVDLDSPPTGGCLTTTLSNWSAADEIERLIRINSLKPVEKEYDFHKEDCTIALHTPQKDSGSFYKRGKNSAKSQRYQCKTCKKITSVLPTKQQNLVFNQKRNEILPWFAKLLVNKTSINRTCEILEIGKGTYYQKLEWLYRCCLEFNETHEKKAFAKKEFPEVWLTTDKLHYVLNNVLKKGRGKNRGQAIEDKQLPTYIVASSEKDSRYVFRADVCFDWDISMDEVVAHTQTHKDDHLASYHRKYDRFGKYGASPMRPSNNDTQTMHEYNQELDAFNLRRNFVDGLHVTQTYTSIAHFWLIKQMVNTHRWRFISDDDESLKKSVFSVFADEVRNKDAHYFLCLTNKGLTRKQAKDAYIKAIAYLKQWAKSEGYEGSIDMLATWYLADQLSIHQFHQPHFAPNGEVYYTHLKSRIEHPIPSIDRGYRELDVLTDMNHLSNHGLANALIKVNDNAVNVFFQTIRRRLSILERPLVTARGDGKSYIYSNFNPKYSQMAITILRTYYNFCMTFKSKGKEQTPAQALGITEKLFNWNDIIYKR